ncbi:bile acid:sodium symporter [Amycolatopsis albispora]|uniref:Bile acid:sodium symporter n=2 Tax=Amycolatopsis albispora TaxID=1804986 RepID=A0A344LKV5_9PSEU|nr:bile acid:sodium symporter [Amycolatopsis albispora]
MFGLGLSLTTKDFARVLSYPKAVVVALVCQVLVLPAACFGLVYALSLPPELAVGMMLLAASPGGTTANLFSHLAHGDVALNITLTAVNSLLAVLTLPLVVNFALGHFLTADAGIGLQFGKTVQVFAIVLIPVALGMLARHRVPALADRTQKPVKLLSVVFLIGTILVAVYQERENITGYLADVGLATFLFSVLSIGVGYLAPRLFKVDRRQSIAAAMEIGIHNSVLAITIALTLLNSTQIAIPAAVYGIVMFFTAGAFGFLISRRVAAPAVGSAP